MIGILMHRTKSVLQSAVVSTTNLPVARSICGIHTSESCNVFEHATTFLIWPAMALWRSLPDLICSIRLSNSGSGRNSAIN
jgi:hypothetical protein